MLKRQLAFAAAMAAGILVSALPARATVVDFHTWAFDGSDGSNTLSMSGNLTTSPFVNAVGGHDVYSIGGSVSFNGGPLELINGLTPNSNQPYFDPTGTFDNVVYYNPQPAGYNLDGYGLMFSYGSGTAAETPYDMHVWGLHGYNVLADPAHTSDLDFPLNFTGNFLLDPSPTPLPAALPLFAGGLGVIGLLARRRKRKNAAALAAA